VHAKDAAGDPVIPIESLGLEEPATRREMARLIRADSATFDEPTRSALVEAGRPSLERRKLAAGDRQTTIRLGARCTALVLAGDATGMPMNSIVVMACLEWLEKHQPQAAHQAFSTSDPRPDAGIRSRGSRS